MRCEEVTLGISSSSSSSSSYSSSSSSSSFFFKRFELVPTDHAPRCMAANLVRPKWAEPPALMSMRLKGMGPPDSGGNHPVLFE